MDVAIAPDPSSETTPTDEVISASLMDDTQSSIQPSTTQFDDFAEHQDPEVEPPYAAVESLTCHIERADDSTGVVTQHSFLNGDLTLSLSSDNYFQGLEDNDAAKFMPGNKHLFLIYFQYLNSLPNN